MHIPGPDRVPCPSRRSLVRAALTLPGALLAGGCSGRLPLDLGGNTMSDAITVESVDDAISLALEQLSERHGEGFHLVGEVEPITYEPGPGKVGYTCCLAPDASPERYFTAMVVAEAETGRLSHDVESNYSQWLFKGRAEEPYRRVLEQDEATVGYATSMFYTRMDAKLWREDQLEEYMGDGGSNEPRVEAIAVRGSRRPSGGSTGRCASSPRGAGPTRARTGCTSPRPRSRSAALAATHRPRPTSRAGSKCATAMRTSRPGTARPPSGTRTRCPSARASPRSPGSDEGDASD